MRTLALILLLGCAPQIREARAVQPNPSRALGSAEVLPVSATLHVYTRDNYLPYSWQLRSSVRFAVVDRDTIRVHFSVARRDQREADTFPGGSGSRTTPAAAWLPRRGRWRKWTDC